MTRDRSPDRVTEHRLAGVYCRFEYYWKRKNVVVIPDEDDLKDGSCYAVLYVWNCVASWAVRFVAANSGWTVNGESPVETLGDDFH